MGGGGGQAKQQEQANEQFQMALAQQDAARQNKIYNQLAPYATSFLNTGANALNGIAPAYFQNAELPSLESGFKGARQNLLNFFGSSGQGISGLAAGPLANEQAMESTAMDQAKVNAILQGLNIGAQGANMLAGQQSVFNPLPYSQAATQSNQAIYQMSQNPWMGLLGGAIGALPLGNLFGKIPGFGPNAAPTSSIPNYPATF